MYWPAGLRDRATAVSGVYSAFHSWQTASKVSNFSQRNPGAWKTILMVREMRKRNKAKAKRDD